MKSCCLLLCIFISVLTRSQDSAFIEHYKNFRAATDSMNSFSIYLKSPFSKQKHSLASYRLSFDHAFHFLRSKKLKNKKADFVVNILVKDLQVHRPPIRSSTPASLQTKHRITTNYSLSLDLEVHRDGKMIFTMPICSDTLLNKVYEYTIKTPQESEYHEGKLLATHLGDPGYQVAIESDKTKTEPGIEDIRVHLIAIMNLYKNYYLDRIDWSSGPRSK